jgi:hypothetical protein
MINIPVSVESAPIANECFIPRKTIKKYCIKYSFLNFYGNIWFTRRKTLFKTRDPFSILKLKAYLLS